MERDDLKLPLVTDVLEPYRKTPDGLTLWKRKGAQLISENLLDNVFLLSNEIADYFAIRHNNLVNQNICKLQQERCLPKRLLNFKQPYLTGNNNEKFRKIYALTRHQTYHLIMDFAGPRARNKKHAIVKKLEEIEADVLRGAFSEARQKAQEFDGIRLIEEFGFSCSAGERLATKKDIARFLKVPESTVSSFLAQAQ